RPPPGVPDPPGPEQRLREALAVEPFAPGPEAREVSEDGVEDSDSAPESPRNSHIDDSSDDDPHGSSSSGLPADDRTQEGDPGSEASSPGGVAQFSGRPLLQPEHEAELTLPASIAPPTRCIGGRALRGSDFGSL